MTNSDSYRDANRSDKLGTDLNRDPLTGEPGAHAVGAGTGAALGATVGGVVGAVGGPLGVVAGAAIGGVAGGLVGKGTAEAINPTGEVNYWRGEFNNRPYARGRTFTDYEPVYFNTASQYGQYAGKSFEEVEPELERSWKTNRKTSTLDWRDAREASRDGWERLAKQSKDSTPTREHESAESVNSLVEFLYDGVKGFQQSADAVKEPSIKAQLQRFASEREQFIFELKPLIASRGEVPEDAGTIRGAMHRGWIGLKNALTTSDHAIVAECERGEDAAVAKYRAILEDNTITPELRRVLQTQFTSIQRAHDTVRNLRDSLAK